MKRLLGFTLAAVLVMIGALAPSALAQSTGNIYGTITDESGAVLPGVNVRLTSPLSNRETTSDAAGNFRFLSLDH